MTGEKLSQHLGINYSVLRFYLKPIKTSNKHHAKDYSSSVPSPSQSIFIGMVEAENTYVTV